MVEPHSPLPSSLLHNYLQSPTNRISSPPGTHLQTTHLQGCPMASGPAAPHGIQDGSFWHKTTRRLPEDFQKTPTGKSTPKTQQPHQQIQGKMLQGSMRLLNATFCKPQVSLQQRKSQGGTRQGHLAGVGSRNSPGSGKDHLPLLPGEQWLCVHIGDLLRLFSFLPLCNRNHSAAQERLITVPALLIIARSHS